MSAVARALTSSLLAPPITIGMLALGLTLTVAAAPARAQTGSTFRTGIDVVNFGVAVIDKQGTAVDGLTVKDFELFENGQKQELRYFAVGKDGKEVQPPLHIGLLFDTSGSMSEDIEMARSAAVKFCNRLLNAEDITIVEFDTEVRSARFGQDAFPHLVERLRKRRPDGFTALYDALGVYLDGARDQLGQKVLVLYTDGGDNRSALSFNDLLTSLKATDVTVYAIGFMQHQGSGRNDQQLHLQTMADASGGLAFFPMSLKEIDKAYDRVVQELEGRYMLGYVSTNTKMDGTWRPVEIRLTRGDLKNSKMRTRKGYFAPFREASKDN
jgi:Ca-activated chloride channel family protein